MRFTPILAAAAYVGSALAADAFHCDGSAMCGALRVEWCDIAVNTLLRRNDQVSYGSEE